MRRTTASTWTRLWFRGAAIYGVVALLPLYFQPAGDKAHFYYGFVGTALVFQFIFWTIGGDPRRYRALMPLGVLEKLAFGVPVALLFAQSRVDALTFGAGLIDLALGAGFLLAWRATPPA